MENLNGEITTGTELHYIVDIEIEKITTLSVEYVSLTGVLVLDVSHTEL